MKTIKREHLKTKFSPDHILKEAERIINPAASQDEQYGQYYKIAQMHDISAMAYIELGWDAAMDELQRRERKGNVVNHNQG